MWRASRSSLLRIHRRRFRARVRMCASPSQPARRMPGLATVIFVRAYPHSLRFPPVPSLTYFALARPARHRAFAARICTCCLRCGSALHLRASGREGHARWRMIRSHGARVASGAARRLRRCLWNREGRRRDRVHGCASAGAGHEVDRAHRHGGCPRYLRPHHFGHHQHRKCGQPSPSLPAGISVSCYAMHAFAYMGPLFYCVDASLLMCAKDPTGATCVWYQRWDQVTSTKTPNNLQCPLACSQLAVLPVRWIRTSGVRPVLRARGSCRRHGHRHCR